MIHARLNHGPDSATPQSDHDNPPYASMRCKDETNLLLLLLLLNPLLLLMLLQRFLG